MKLFSCGFKEKVLALFFFLSTSLQCFFVVSQVSCTLSLKVTNTLGMVKILGPGKGPGFFSIGKYSISIKTVDLIFVCSRFVGLVATSRVFLFSL